MPAEPASSEIVIVLSDGGRIHIRPIEPEDADGIVALHSRFSERTRYMRFFSAYPRIPDRDLARFVNVDHRDREALVATIGGVIIAVGRYERLQPGEPVAEVAFAVEDLQQGRGIAPILLGLLADAARPVGINRFVAEVLPSNGAMLRVFGRAGYEIVQEYADGVVHVELDLEPVKA